MFLLQKIEQPFLEAVKRTLGDRYSDNVDTIYRITIKFIIEELVKGFEGIEDEQEEPEQEPESLSWNNRREEEDKNIGRRMWTRFWRNTDNFDGRLGLYSFGIELRMVAELREVWNNFGKRARDERQINEREVMQTGRIESTRLR